MSLAPFRETLREALPERPFRIVFWDGSELPSTTGTGPTFEVRSPDAFGHVLRSPGQLGIGRAHVSGALEVDDLDAVLDLFDGWTPPPIDRATQAKLALAAVRAGGLRRVPPVPDAELAPKGRRHSRARDQRAVRHHYDVSNEFFSLFLDESMTYSCALWSTGATTLEEAQHAKLELVCRKLELQPGQRMLDVGCGWGSLAMHAAREHGVQVLGITLAENQAELARQRVADAGLSDQVEIRLMDYRDLAEEPFDAVSSIGMVEHVGNVNIDAYCQILASQLKPGGWLLNHGIARLRHTDPEAGPFSERFVFPDAAPLHLSRILSAIERSGVEPIHVEGLRLDYARTIVEWTKNLEANHDRALAIAGPERMRVWAIYLRSARRGFESGFTSVFQVRGRKPA